MESINISKISSKGQIVLPKSIRDKFSSNDDVVFIENGNEIILRKSSDVLNDLNYLKFQENTFNELQKYEENKDKYPSMKSKEFISFLKEKVN